MRNSLTIKQQQFCKEFVITRNASSAALAAGFSSNYAKKRAYELLQDERISTNIEELEKVHTADLVKKMQRKALQKLDEVLNNSDDKVALKAIEQVLRISGLTKALEIEAESKDTIIRVRLPDDL